MRLRAILAIAFGTLLGDCQGRWQKLGLAWIHRLSTPPDAREIGLAVHGARRGTGRRLVPFHVGDLVRAIFAQSVELRGVAEANVERRGLGCLDRDALFLKTAKAGCGS